MDVHISTPKTSSDDVWLEIDLSDLAAELPHCHWQSNGQLSALVTAAGAGYVQWHQLAITRWRPDRVEEAYGSYYYLRDLESGSYWSIGFQPTRQVPLEYVFRGAAGWSEISRRDEQLFTSLRTVVVPSADVLLRRCTISNNSSRARIIELTSYEELALQELRAYEGHPAFSKLFVKTEFDAPSGAILARRRARQTGERHPTYLTMMVAENGLLKSETNQFETDRARFIGRNRSRARPRAMETDQLSQSVGSVLDPIASLRTILEIPAGESRSLTFVSCVHWERAGAVELAERFSEPAAIEKACDDARAAHDNQVTAHQLSPRELQDANRLVAAAEFGTPAVNLLIGGGTPRLGCDPVVELQNSDAPGIVAYAHNAEPEAYRRQLRAFAALWRGGHACRLVIVANTASGSSLDDLQAFVNATIEAEHRQQITVLNEQQLTVEQLHRLSRLARASLDLAGDLSELDVGTTAAVTPAVFDKLSQHRATDARHPSTSDNGCGDFSDDGSEYVMRLPMDTPTGGPPLPWVNVIANEHGGFLVSEDGAGYAWSRNSRQSRLTPWSNDPVCDPHGEAFYLRDDDSGQYWSALPGPVRQQANYEVRHGFGYSVFAHRCHDIAHEVVQFVVRDEPCKITRVRLKNEGQHPRRLSAFSYCQWVLGDDTLNTGRLLRTQWVPDARALVANQVGQHDFPLLQAYLACWAPTDTNPTYTSDRSEFIGRLNDTSQPAAVTQGSALNSRVGNFADPCAALKVGIELQPGEERELVFALGEAADADALSDLAQRYASGEAVEQALQEVKGFWSDFVGRVRVQTPAKAIDVMVNGWLPYQNLSCRMWGRSAFYQGGGAFGFRDQLQDAAALVYHDPQLSRQQILLHAEHQFVEGDVLHWWHPGAEVGLRTRFSDDLLWLPSLTMDYVSTTGDAAVWDEPRHFLRARQLAAAEQEAYLKPEIAAESASVYEHCCRAIDRSLTTGKHGLPLMGAGDWNDGMNRIGHAGRGESVWLGFFLFDILSRILPEIERRNDHPRLQRYRKYRENLRRALNENAWDGEWFVRAFDDNGAPIGSHRCDECKIDALVQAWSVLSGAADDEKARQALDSVHQHLTDEQAGIIRLLTPPFDKTELDPGYIKGYLPGIRENGGQYTHGILWVIKAWAKLGQGDRAASLLEMISPVTHTRDRQAVQTYQTEPYVVAADVYGEPPHVGRGGWSWYTGSAGWMFRVALESVLGLQIEGGHTLVLKPCLAADWQECNVRYRWPTTGTEFDIRIRNPDRKQLGVRKASVDGRPTEVKDGAARIDMGGDQGRRTVHVEM